MKILFISDAHIIRDWDVHLKELERLTSENQYDLVIDCGDTNHRPMNVGSEVESNLIRYVEILSKYGTIPMYIVMGTLTHTGKFNESEALVKLFQKLNTTIISTPTIVGEILFVPELYTSPSKNFALNLLNGNIQQGETKIKVIALHGVVNGFFNTGESEELDDFEMTVPSTMTFNVSDFQGIRTFAGHYHIRTTKDNFTYVGAFCTNTFGEIDPNGKGILIYDMTTNETEFIKRENDNQFINYQVNTILDTVKLKKLINDSKGSNIKYRGVLMNNDDSVLRALKTTTSHYVIRYEDETSKVEQEQATKNEDKFLSDFKSNGLVSCMSLYSVEFMSSELDEKELSFLK